MDFSNTHHLPPVGITHNAYRKWGVIKEICLPHLQEVEDLLRAGSLFWPLLRALVDEVNQLARTLPGHLQAADTADPETPSQVHPRRVRT